MLGQPVSMLIPQVIGVKLTGALPEGTTATDLVLTVTEMLRKKGVVGKFVEFFGDGLAQLPLADRATIANMAPEYGATCGIFPVDDETLAVPALHGARRGAGQARRGVLQGAGALPRARRARSEVHRRHAPRPRLDRAEPRGADAPAGPGQADGSEDGLPLVAREAPGQVAEAERAELEGRRDPRRQGGRARRTGRWSSPRSRAARTRRTRASSSRRVCSRRRPSRRGSRASPG